ncbi:unnamed protein product [Cyprideis torosa]|uniref:Uncharacterized protein n=1 Tax=Cyprideis torosa TaxID=163714 RepID=A0A7R8WT04_9CRUS|nr:unnamed protein product [Cyprideis torosa]CAG0904327.1 unnamed protein product [Cyprideis torosa]
MAAVPATFGTMAEFPLEPKLAKVLIMSVDLQCSDELLTIVSMLSVQNVFYRPKDKQTLADQKKANFNQAEGDLQCSDELLTIVSMLSVQNVFYRPKDKQTNRLVFFRLKNASEKHLDGWMSNGRRNVGYRTLVHSQEVYIHPSSALFNRRPEWVVYHELLQTTKNYMRECTAVDPKWLVEFAPILAPIGPHTTHIADGMAADQPPCERFSGVPEALEESLEVPRVVGCRRLDQEQSHGFHRPPTARPTSNQKNPPSKRTETA